MPTLVFSDLGSWQKLVREENKMTFRKSEAVEVAAFQYWHTCKKCGYQWITEDCTCCGKCGRAVEFIDK